jgi:hypothetical protein
VLLFSALGACQARRPRPRRPEPRTQHGSSLRDMSSRQVFLRTPEGTRATVVAGPEVRNLPQLRAGDRVTVAYQ